MLCSIQFYSLAFVTNLCSCAHHYREVVCPAYKCSFSPCQGNIYFFVCLRLGRAVLSIHSVHIENVLSGYGATELYCILYIC